MDRAGVVRNIAFPNLELYYKAVIIETPVPIKERAPNQWNKN